MQDITEDMYEKIINNVKKYLYSEKNIHNINATFRKLIQLCYKKKLLRHIYMERDFHTSILMDIQV